MKARMKEPTSIRTVGTLALLIVSGLALAASREPVSVSGQVDLNTFEGTATVTIPGQQLEGTVQVIPLAPPEPKDGGLYFPVVEHWFMFPDAENPTDILITTGEELAMPTDENPAVYTLHGNMEIIAESAQPEEGPSATGQFQGVSGELRVNGQMDFSVGQATFEAHGTISR
ncbi:MAG: hypothetical protein JSU70_14745 [Phycisphaerales bacterium]|nr:MAG: hypothetical protein JSU70_14745 [Phycisphaerales bacterium]